MKLEQKKDIIPLVISLIILAIHLLVLSKYNSLSGWLSPIVLYILVVLIFISQAEIRPSFLLFFFSCYVLTMIAEIIGIRSSVFFGNFDFGKGLGFAILNVPVVMGLVGFIIVFCSGILTESLYRFIEKKYPPDNLFPSTVQKFSIVVDGAFISTFLVWALERATEKLDWWHWPGSTVPFMNYVTWFFLSAVLLLLFELLNFRKINQFAVHLYIVLLLFFLTAGTIL
ncbi:MAG: carotenoid biosynthesis protein [Chitinophagaceae bacterium]|nr:carotenoid biosynthesis protein [Chitinophagaceae bacterium]